MKNIVASVLTIPVLGLAILQALVFVDRYGRGVRGGKGPEEWIHRAQGLLSSVGLSQVADEYPFIEYRWLLWLCMVALLGVAVALAVRHPRAGRSWLLHGAALVLLAGLGIFHLRDAPTHERIPTLFEPRFVRADQVDFLGDDDPVIAISHEGVSKAYPLWMVMRHHVINDRLAGDPVVATY